MISLGLEFQLEENHCRILPQRPFSSLSFAQILFFFLFLFCPLFSLPYLTYVFLISYLNHFEKQGKYHFEKQGEYKWKGKKRNEFVYRKAIWRK